MLMNLVRSRRAFLGLALIALTAACDSSQDPGSTSTTTLLPPETNPAFPGAGGSARHHVAGADREIEIEVLGVPPGTELSFFYNSTHFASATATSQGRARIQFRTADGDSVPFSVEGAVIRVESEGVLVVSGTF